jgi:hypothetical protein
VLFRAVHVPPRGTSLLFLLIVLMADHQHHE